MGQLAFDLRPGWPTASEVLMEGNNSRVGFDLVNALFDRCWIFVGRLLSLKG